MNQSITQQTFVGPYVTTPTDELKL